MCAENNMLKGNEPFTSIQKGTMIPFGILEAGAASYRKQMI